MAGVGGTAGVGAGSGVRKFYQLSASERLDVLREQGVLGGVEEYEAFARAQSHGILAPDVAAHLIENQVSQYALPLGVVPGLRVNGREYTVPLVVEEASVVAAASNGARMTARAGIHAESELHRVLGEVVFLSDDVSADYAQEVIVSRETFLFARAEEALPSMHARGGGLESLEVRATPDGRFTRILLTVNPCDAMGANAVNTISEALRAVFEDWFGAQALVAILSNAGDDSVTTAEVELEPEDVAVRGMDPRSLVERIALLSELSQSDYLRAVTHNKGIMNGVSSAVLASGNDTRALEASVHAFAAQSGVGEGYQPLSTWTVLDNGHLFGRIRLPLQVGIVGGAASSIPLAKAARAMGAYETVTDFKNVLAALGLVQNLSAIRALAGPGIQAGHMNLQMNALAIAAGASGEQIERIAAQLRALPASERTAARARELVEQLNSSENGD
ncbi:hydroxymethylglutaryl-CoA reductase, degradative [Alloscardovia macacae]|uniref:3-hydroxy-3-methylglutaryl coenzyme A reductase n=1 Tax=Alloscardovia macacae TaxID=1160091 RepID=A0A1Y2T188_9BIFI|nr:hydroxymethylglutaryl-CoA reductase, degradative [Alloscardovia macacae]OTA28929.1 hydroxymethylglutaryl-CoA reductase, degradative [Alloscardovia macacae]